MALLLLVCRDLYYAAFPRDHHLLKLIVIVQLLLETIQTVMFTHDIFEHFTQAYIDPTGLNEVGTLWLSVTLMIGLSTWSYICVSAQWPLTESILLCTNSI